MSAIVDIYSKDNFEIKRFLDAFYEHNVIIDNNSKWEIIYKNPVDCADIIGSYIDNNEKFKINLWVSLDKGFFINVTPYNANKIIRYLYERYPY